MARYFRISKSDLIEDHGEDYYYLDEETRAIAEELLNNTNLRALLDAGRGLKADDLRIAENLLNSLKKKERKGDD